MQQFCKKLPLFVGLVMLAMGVQILILLLGINLFMRWYTISTLNWASSRGVYATPQEGVIANAYRAYCGVERVEIEQAATNSFDGSDPHVWYVIFRVYARSHTPCDPAHPGQALYHQTYDNGGTFYLQTKKGWVMMPESRFPEVLGKWMKKLDLAGPGDSYHVPRE